jgi:hypothetical protein
MGFGDLSTVAEVPPSAEFPRNLFGRRSSPGRLPHRKDLRLNFSRWTLDTYGHLFPRGDESKVLDAAEQALLA